MTSHPRVGLRIAALLVSTALLPLTACGNQGTGGGAAQDSAVVAQATAPAELVPSAAAPTAPQGTAQSPLPSSTDADAQPAATAAGAPPVAPALICAAPPSGSNAPPARVRSTGPPPIGAAAAVVIDAGSATVLWGKDEHVPQQPASTTKVITALLAVERGNLDAVINVELEQRLLNVGTAMGLQTGDWFTLRDLLYGALLPSGNDAARVIATYLSGSEAAFAAQMNERLCTLGLTDSSFINASGLGRGEYNMTSAYDLAQVMRVAMENAEFARITRARSWTARGSRTLNLNSLNDLVGSYPGVDGGKIGWTPGAGHTIVASATRNGHRIVVALLRTPNRAGEAAALIDWAFASYRW